MGIFRRKPRTIPAFDQPRTYQLPTPGELALQPNIERACEVYWAAAHPDQLIRWETTSHETRTYIRQGVAAVLHWAQQQGRQ